MASKITAAIVKSLTVPKPNSHKRDNGRLLVISGSHLYFGALLYCVKTASRIVDLIYVLTTKDNINLIKKLKSQTAEFMPVKKYPSKQGLTDVDCILIGPGMGVSNKTKQLVRQALNSGKRVVLDADALNVLTDELKNKLNQNHILTPHLREFERLFKLKATPPNVEKMAKKYRCTIVLKGKVDVVGKPDGKIYYNYTGNVGMTKGGTGDVLAGLMAAFYCTNDAFISAAAAVFINGRAGDELYKKQGRFYNAEDLSNQIPLTLKKLIR